MGNVSEERMTRGFQVVHTALLSTVAVLCGVIACNVASGTDAASVSLGPSASAYAPREFDDWEDSYAGAWEDTLDGDEEQESLDDEDVVTVEEFDAASPLGSQQYADLAGGSSDGARDSRLVGVLSSGFDLPVLDIEYPTEESDETDLSFGLQEGDDPREGGGLGGDEWDVDEGAAAEDCSQTGEVVDDDGAAAEDLDGADSDPGVGGVEREGEEAVPISLDGFLGGDRDDLVAFLRMRGEDVVERAGSFVTLSSSMGFDVLQDGARRMVVSIRVMSGGDYTLASVDPSSTLEGVVSSLVESGWRLEDDEEAGSGTLLLRGEGFTLRLAGVPDGSWSAELSRGEGGPSGASGCA